MHIVWIMSQTDAKNLIKHLGQARHKFWVSYITSLQLQINEYSGIHVFLAFK